MDLKEKIHALVDACNDDVALQDAYSFLQKSSLQKDWWDELSIEQQGITKASLQQSANGETFSNDEIQQRIWSKFEK